MDYRNTILHTAICIPDTYDHIYFYCGGTTPDEDFSLRENEAILADVYPDDYSSRKSEYLELRETIPNSTDAFLFFDSNYEQ